MKNLLWTVLLFCSIPAFSQTSIPAKDTSSSRHDGTGIKVDKQTGQPADDKLPSTDNKLSSVQTPADMDDDQPIHWSDPTIPHEALKKHRTGLGLVISGTGLLVGGVVIAAGAANSSSTTYSNGTVTQSYVKVNGLGVLGILAGIPMVIVGAVKLSRANRIARRSMVHLR
jgi:hypothetical protein